MRGGRRGGRRGRQRVEISDEIRATVIDHVLVHGLTMREAGLRVQPNLSRFSVSTIVRTFREENRMRMKQVYRVTFECNSPRVKELRAQYVQIIFDLDRPYEFIFVDKAGFNLTKSRRRDRNMIGQRATVEVPGQRGGNVTICAAISNHGVLHHHVTLGPYNTQHLLRFIANLRDILFEQQVQEQQGQELNESPIPTYVIVWDNVSFHRAAQKMEQGFRNCVLAIEKNYENITTREFNATASGAYAVTNNGTDTYTPQEVTEPTAGHRSTEEPVGASTAARPLPASGRLLVPATDGNQSGNKQMCSRDVALYSLGSTIDGYSKLQLAVKKETNSDIFCIQSQNRIDGLSHLSPALPTDSNFDSLFKQFTSFLFGMEENSGQTATAEPVASSGYQVEESYGLGANDFCQFSRTKTNESANERASLPCDGAVQFAVGIVHDRQQFV
ncbi:hypothetical protein F2P81_007529 [Scophthalmus maximus]|uniref:Tc1-like transposase DDE domain-containing protein n=1 Tax=Scophthalmus maximus TaxID=52904 RepID=A0A6A4T7W2_SCOMX|nr:hypothetical protein F2P81_007529 [Scophthalmus maximus]